MHLMRIYRQLVKQFGEQRWWPVRATKRAKGRDPVFEVMIGAILTQNTSWKNVERAIEHLHRARCLDARGVALVDDEQLKRMIRPAGYFNQKSRKLKILAEHIVTNYQGSARAAAERMTRAELLALWGIGPETADSILLYAGNRPEFVIDAYTRRLCERYGVCFDDYHDYKAYFEQRLPQDAALYNEFHALIVAWGQLRKNKENTSARKGARSKMQQVRQK